MDEITPQRIGEYLRIVFRSLWSENTGLPVGDIMADISQAIPLTAYERAEIPATHTPRYERAVRLAMAPYVKTGWLAKSKGRWFLTDAGKRACRSFTNAQAFYQEAARMLDEWRQSRADQVIVTDEAEEKAWEQVRSYLQGLQPYEFQSLIGDLLTAMGYTLAWVAPREKQRGFINFVIYTDPLGLSDPRIKVHVLHSGQPVLMEGMKTFISSLGSEDAGIFISSGGFTGSAIEEAYAQKSRRITLIDLESLFDLWVEYYDRLDQAGRQRFPLKPIHFLASL